MKEDKRLVIRVDSEFHKTVKDKAKVEDLTVSQLVRRLLRKWLEELSESGKP